MKKAYHHDPCYVTHRPLKLPVSLLLPEGGEIHGGSCINPVVLDADVYIGFDRSMTTGRACPWQGPDKHEIYWPVQDMGVPADAEAFKLLVGWTIERVRDGKKVHAGCIGGHGRTGLFFAAIVCALDPDGKDQVAYVREHYCDHAVESDMQVKFLAKHFGYKPRKETKSSKQSVSAPSPWPLVIDNKKHHDDKPRLVVSLPGRAIWDLARAP